MQGRGRAGRRKRKGTLGRGAAQGGQKTQYLLGRKEKWAGWRLGAALWA